MKVYKHLFGFGDPRGIREIFLSRATFLKAMYQPWSHYGYPDHEGSSSLIGDVRKLVERLTGISYKHVLITNGATNAINAYVYAKKKELSKYPACQLVTHKLYFPFYPMIASIHDLGHDKVDVIEDLAINDIAIVDSPSNPEGKLSDAGSSRNVLWDSVYHTPTYTGMYQNGSLVMPKVAPKHDALAGSLSKLTGISGLRVGWLATQKKPIYSDALDYITADLCGVSALSQFTASQIINKVNFDKFFDESKRMLDLNREELSKLSYLFGNQPIFPNGMFALFESDKKLGKLLEKAGVQIIPGSAAGDERESVRINLANSNNDTKSMVNDVLKADNKA